MDLDGQFVGWRHDDDLGRSQRRIYARKEGQEISQCFTGTRLRSQIRVLSGSERRNGGDLNKAGVGYLLLRERRDEFGRQRQIGKLHEIELGTGVGNTYLSRRMVVGRAVILSALPATPIAEGNGVGAWLGMHISAGPGISRTELADVFFFPGKTFGWKNSQLLRFLV